MSFSRHKAIKIKIAIADKQQLSFYFNGIRLSLAGCSPAEPTSASPGNPKMGIDLIFSTTLQNIQVHFCPLGDIIYKRGTLLSITPVFSN